MMRGRITDQIHPPQPKRPKTSEATPEKKYEIEAKLKQVIMEQEQTFLHLVEERRTVVAMIEAQRRDIQSQVPGNLSLFLSHLVFSMFVSVVCC